MIIFTIGMHWGLSSPFENIAFFLALTKQKMHFLSNSYLLRC